MKSKTSLASKQHVFIICGALADSEQRKGLHDGADGTHAMATRYPII
jgi:hypothetical protein